jgi:hypothetical protein
MDYVLMNKNTPVLLVDIDGSGHIDKVLEQYDTRFLPFGVKLDKPAYKLSIKDWWHSRAIPASRDGLYDILLKFGISVAQELLIKSYGLSLSDQYWIKPADKKIEWKDVNFFGNEFSVDVGKIAFSEDYAKPSVKINFYSPDNTSDGWLKKKWVIHNGERCLIKAGNGVFRQEPFNEVIASSIFRRLNMPFIQYDLCEVNEEYCCICKNFVTSDTELVTAWQVYNTEKQHNHMSLYQHMLDMADKLGIPDAQPNIDGMLVGDYIIANSDRHFGNFGFIRDVNTLAFVSPAPVYDTGTSLWHNEGTILPGQPPKSKPFRDNHEEQIKLVKDTSLFDLAALKGLDEEANEILKKNSYIDDKRRGHLCLALSYRINRLEKLLPKKAILPVEEKPKKSKGRSR